MATIGHALGDRGWARSVVKSRLLASFQTYHRLRTDLLDAAQANDGARLTAALQAFARRLNEDADWLSELDPVPAELRSSPRARYLAVYARQLRDTMQELHRAVRTRPLTSEAFDPFGVAILQLLALEHGARQL